VGEYTGSERERLNVRSVNRRTRWITVRSAAPVYSLPDERDFTPGPEGLGDGDPPVERGDAIPRETAACMRTITEMRSASEYQAKTLSIAETVAVEGAWLVTKEWAGARGITLPGGLGTSVRPTMQRTKPARAMMLRADLSVGRTRLVPLGRDSSQFSSPSNCSSGFRAGTRTTRSR
jgi:hypothetical protein